MKLTQLLTCFVFVSCATNSMKNKESRSWEDFSHLEVSTDTRERVRKKLGPAVETSENTDKNLDKKIERWIYTKNGVPKFFAVFMDGILQSTSMSVWESEEESNLKLLLAKFAGNWKVILEPQVNPHALPTMCYLVDEENGRKIKIHGHKMVVGLVSKWAPKMLVTEDLTKVNRPEFCIADVCAKVSEGSEWKSDHCDQLKEWLKQFNGR